MTNAVLWVLQILLAALFGLIGVSKSLLDKERLLKQGQDSAAYLPMPVVRFIGATELLATAGLLLPWATGIARVLTPLAAVGLCVLMGIATVINIAKRAPRTVILNVVLLAAALAVAIGRFTDLS